MIRQLIYLFTFAFLLISCSVKENTAAEPEAASDEIQLSPEQITKADIRIAKPERVSLVEEIRANGKLDVPPQNLVDVSAPMGGFVQQTSLLQGMRVKKGELLVVLRHPDYIQLQQDYLTASSQLELQEAEYQRQQQLAAGQVNAQKTLQQSKAAFEGAKANVQGLEAKLNMISLMPSKIKSEGIQNSIRLYSPIEGYVTEVNINVGKYVSSTDVMLRIVDTEHLHAEIQVFEKDVPRLKIGQKINVSLVNETEVREARVYVIGKEISSERTLRVHGHFVKDDPSLIPGMFINASIECNPREVWALPSTAVVVHEGKNHVVVARGNSFKLVPVETGGNAKNMVEVRLNDEAQQLSYVINGAYTLLSLMTNKEEE